MVYLLLESKSPYHIVGKVFMGVLGSIVVINVAFDISDKVTAHLLSRSSETVVGRLFVGSITASLTFTTFYLADKYLQILRGPMLQGWCVFIASALFTVVVPALVVVVKDAPDINNYVASELLVGVLIGGVYYLARSLLRSKPEKAEQSTQRKD